MTENEMIYTATDMRYIYETYYKDFYRDIAADRARKQSYRFLTNSLYPVPKLSKPPIFNPPATICYWNDGTKTVVKCQEGDTYSPEAGLALCYMKKVLGNTSNDLNKELHKYIQEEKEEKKELHEYIPEEKEEKDE